VMNQQRMVIYRHRREALSGKSLKSSIEDMIRSKAGDIAGAFADEKLPAEEWDLKGLEEEIFKQFAFRLPPMDDDTLEGLNADGLSQLIEEEALKVYGQKEAQIGEKDSRYLERMIMLQVVDNLWKDHLLSMDHLKDGIGLRGYAQQNPLVVYKKEGYEMFSEMIARIQEQTLSILFRIQVEKPDKIKELQKPKEQTLLFSSGKEEQKKKPVQRQDTKVGRNEPCPCGSGKKFKKCCGA
jgi:preprotein translocase subunit SecA